MQSSEEEPSRKRKHRPERLEYLDQLVVEFHTTKVKDAKEQVLANLANFAYDPFNYNFFRQLAIIDLFLENLSGADETLIKFSIGGLCNLCLDPLNKEIIVKNGLGKIIALLDHYNEDVVLSTITTLIFLITPESKPNIVTTDVIKSMIKYSKGTTSRTKNLSEIFLRDFCSEEQIQKASQSEDTAHPSTLELSQISIPDS